MKPSHERPEESDQRRLSHNVGEPEAEFEQSLAEVERSLQDLKTRYQQVQIDQQQQTELQERRDRLRQELSQTPTPELQTELKQIRNQLETLEVSLESRLISESSLREIFWQMVRFGGLGIVIGWFLAFAVIKSPQPAPQPSQTVPTYPQPQ
jgi:predicted RNase H-like nuclease (RuvC/YqgF family)